jgi:ABC-type nitrate/sulfonate/bicarbonate transport system substrate-binding protein
MDLTFAHYRNRFCMFRTYYALAAGTVKPDGFNIRVIELPDPPSREQEAALIRGEVQVANLYLPNFLQRKLQGAPIVGLCTEWKSTMKGNGMFVRKDSAVQKPQDLPGSVIGSHQGPHAIHRYLLRRRFGVDGAKLTWESHRQEELLSVLKSGKVDGAVLLDQIIGAREDLLRDHPGIKDKLLRAFRASFCWSEEHLPEIAEEFVKRYPGDKEALLASARYPRIEFTMTEQEQKLADAEMDMMVEVGWIPRKAPVPSLFAIE